MRTEASNPRTFKPEPPLTSTKMGKRVNRPNYCRVKVRRRLMVERLSERRVLAAITGTVFDDANFSFQKESDEVAAPRRLIYIDANDNAELDNGESFVVAEDDGTFEFRNLPDGTYLLRLFNGTQTQFQTVPVEASVDGGTLSVADAQQLSVGDGISLSLTSDSLVVGDLPSGSNATTLAVGSQLTRMQTLPDGTVLVVGSNTSGETSWVVDAENGTVTPVDLSGSGSSTPWSDVAVDGNGRGVLIEQSTGNTFVRAIDATDPSQGIQTTTTLHSVPPDTHVLTSNSGPRSVFAWTGTQGLQLSLWSNTTSSFISTSPVDVSGTVDLLAFDDASGLLAVRSFNGGVSVHDVDADFATLHTLDNVTGPVAIDGARDLLLAISPAEAILKLINLRSGALIADLAVDLSSIGQVASLATGNSSDALVVLGAAGVTEVALRKAAAREVTIADSQNADAVLFGVALDGANTAPAYTNIPQFATNEDTPLTAAAPAALTESTDAEGDQFVLVQRGQSENGFSIARIDGSLSYTPSPNFNGTDAINVLLHDGRDASDEVPLNVFVNAVPDSPSGISVTLGPTPENLAPGQPIGNIEVIDADGANGDQHEIIFHDERFGIQGNQIIFIGGDIDFESEPFIEVSVSITDPMTDETIEEIFAISVENVNEPIVGITPTEAFVFENDPGVFIAEILVEDVDVGQSHTLTVDDDRFYFDNTHLTLKPGIFVDFEIEPEIVVHVTATEIPDGGTFTQPIRIEVGDIHEQPQSIALANQSVMELMPGDKVGKVLVDGGTPSSRFSTTVDDPRFEVVDGILKLRHDQFVERATQSEIQLTITVSDTDTAFTSVSETFVIEVLENFAPFHNQDNPYDVDRGGDVTALDALTIINYLNSFGPGPVGSGNPALGYDVNADGAVTALDALLVLNEINRNDTAATVGNGEGEQVTPGEGESTSSETPVSAPPQTSDKIGESSSDEESAGGTPITSSSPKATAWNERSSNADADAIEVPTHQSSKDYADNVDETLRLMSDE